MVDFPSLDPTTRRLPDVVRSQIATDLKDNAQVEGAAIAELLAGVGTGNYTKPADGIPATDLASAVQTSLGKADTALQSVTLPTADTLSGATTVGKSVIKAADLAAAQTAINAADATATQTALNSRLNWRGDYVDGGTYAVNDVVNSPGFGSYKCIQAHTSSGPAPDIESPFWHLLGSSVVIGTNTGQAADGGATTAALGAKLDSGYAGAVAGTTFTVLWVAGSGWPARPTTRTDVFVHWVDITGESTDTDTPADIVTGDRVVRIVTGTGGTSGITVRSVTSAAPVGAVDYLGAPIALTAPTGLAVGDYYLVAACFGSLPIGSDFVVPSGFTRLTPAIASGQDFAVFGRPIGTSADVAACASTNWSPNTHTVTRGVVVGVALEGVGSVGTATAITYTNPMTTPYTLATATGDATFQVVYTGDSSTSSHAVHASVGGTLLVQAMAKSASTDPTPDNVLSISMNGTGVSLTPNATYGGTTNIPMTAA